MFPNKKSIAIKFQSYAKTSGYDTKNTVHREKNMMNCTSL